MAKAQRTIYTFEFEALPHNVIEARRIARFLKEALRLYGLKLKTMKKEPHDKETTAPKS